VGMVTVADGSIEELGAADGSAVGTPDGS